MAQYTIGGDKYLANNKTIYEVVMLSDKDGNIINSFGSASNIPIADGTVTGYSHINKFGGTDGDITAGTIWDGNNGAVTYPYPANGVVTVTSTANTGAAVLIEGLDASFASQSETVVIGGTGTKTFSRIFRARMVDTNNDADVVINQGGSIAAKIIEDQAQTLMAVYTVPAGKTAYLIKVVMGSAKASTNSAMKYSLLARETEDGNIFQFKGIYYAAGGQTLTMDYPVPLKFIEKTDIRIDVTAAQQTEASAIFDIILVDN